MPLPAGLAGRLRQRMRALDAIRAWLRAEGFLEVETPYVVPNPGMDVHLDAFDVSDRRGRLAGRLITSPELHMKRLVAGGVDRCASIARCWRAGELGARHQPEFTMLEWYRVGLDLAGLMEETEQLIAEACRAVHGGTRAAALDLTPPFERLSVRAAFRRHANGLDPWVHTTPGGLTNAARACGLRVSGDAEQWDDVFFQIFLNHVEPALEAGPPVFLHGYPASQAALSRLDPADPTTALRFELYAGGFELANAFDELIDPGEQRRRFLADQAARRLAGSQVPPIDEALIEALGRMRPTSGIALGFDRLVMLASGARSIEDVLWAPVTP